MRICRESLFTVSCRSDRSRTAAGITKNHQRKHIDTQTAARPWKTLADVRMRDKIQARMREVFQEEMSKNGGNEGKWNVEEVETEE